MYNSKPTAHYPVLNGSYNNLRAWLKERKTRLRSVCLSIHLSIINPSVHLYLSLSVCLSIYLSLYLSICLSIYQSICLSIHLSICLSSIYPSIIYLSIRQSICLSIHPSIHLSIYLFVCLSVSLSICLSIYPSVNPSVNPSAYLSAYLSIHPSIHRSQFGIIWLFNSLLHSSHLVLCPSGESLRADCVSEWSDTRGEPAANFSGYHRW